MLPHFFSHLWLDRQKDEYWRAFLEAVPRLVILPCLLQLVVIVGHFFCSSFFFSSSNSSSVSLASARDTESVSATRISLMASYSFIFVAIVYTFGTHTCLNSTVVFDCVTQVQKHQEGTYYYSADSKTYLNLHWQCSGKLLLFKSSQEGFTNVDICCTLVPHNHYRGPHHYKRRVYALFRSCKHRISGISLVFQHHFRSNNHRYSTPLIAVEINISHC
jgi:hypothetical protein